MGLLKLIVVGVEEEEDDEVEVDEGVDFLRYSSVGAEEGGRGSGVFSNSLSLSLDSCCVTSAMSPVKISSARVVS